MENTKFCKYCGEKIDADCVVCPKCGKQIELLKQEAPHVVINNSNVNTNTNHNTNVNMVGGMGNYPYKSRMVALLLAIFLGVLGAHRFYVGKIGTGVLWLLTGGGLVIGWIFDVIAILTGGFRDKANMPLK